MRAILVNERSLVILRRPYGSRKTQSRKFWTRRSSCSRAGATMRSASAKSRRPSASKAPSLYNHFPSKQAIFDALVESVAAQYTRHRSNLHPRPERTAGYPRFHCDHRGRAFRQGPADFRVFAPQQTIRRFRRMTIEQFRSPELSQLYTERYITRRALSCRAFQKPHCGGRNPARKSADAGAFVCLTSHHPPWHLRPRARTGGRVLEEAARTWAFSSAPSTCRQSGNPSQKRNTSMKKRNFTLLWLALCILPTAMLQLRGRIRSAAVRKTILCLLAAVTAILVVGRLISGVHWLNDILAASSSAPDSFCCTRSFARRTAHPTHKRLLPRIHFSPAPNLKLKENFFEPYNVITGACGLTGRSGKSATAIPPEALVHIFRRISHESRKQTQNL